VTGTRDRPCGPTFRSGRFGEGCLRLLCDGAKRRRVVHGEIGEHLAIDFEAGLHQAVDQSAVGQAIDARGRVDARNPERAELALLRAPVAIRILAGLDDGLLGCAIDLAPGVVIALRLGQNFLVTAPRLDATLHSCHVLTPYFDSPAAFAANLARSAFET